MQDFDLFESTTNKNYDRERTEGVEGEQHIPLPRISKKIEIKGVQQLEETKNQDKYAEVEHLF